MIRPNEWYASPDLKRIYEERIEARGINQKQFGKMTGIGSQALIAMLLNRDRPLTIQNATKLARALRCSIHDICPEMAEFLRQEALPVLGKSLRRAAVFTAMAVLPLAALLNPAAAEAAVRTIRVCILCKTALRRLAQALHKFHYGTTCFLHGLAAHGVLAHNQRAAGTC